MAYPPNLSVPLLKLLSHLSNLCVSPPKLVCPTVSNSCLTSQTCVSHPPNVSVPPLKLLSHLSNLCVSPPQTCLSHRLKLLSHLSNLCVSSPKLVCPTAKNSNLTLQTAVTDSSSFSSRPSHFTDPLLNLLRQTPQTSLPDPSNFTVPHLNSSVPLLKLISPTLLYPPYHECLSLRLFLHKGLGISWRCLGQRGKVRRKHSRFFFTC